MGWVVSGSFRVSGSLVTIGAFLLFLFFSLFLYFMISTFHLDFIMPDLQYAELDKSCV